MKKLVLLLFFACFTVIAFAGGWRPGEMEVKVKIDSKTDATQLYQLKLDGDYYLHYAILYLTPNELEMIDALDLDYEIMIDDLNAYYEGFWDTRAEYHSYQEIIDLADSLAEHFPDICTKYNFGTSMGGRELSALKISDNSAIDENEAEVMFDGGIHGDEIGGSENVIRFARDLCLEYGEDPEVTDLVDNREIWLYLMVNPDGRANMVRTNNNGVDLNRDWGYMWDEWGGSTGAYSQVESRALRACSFSNQFAVHTTYHSGTEMISYPWSYRSNSAPDVAQIDQLAAVYSNVSGYSNLDYGQGFSGMYAINGSTKDSNYGIMGSISWSIEISMDKQPPASQLMTYYNNNKPSMLALIEYAGYGLEGTVTDATTGDPVPAVIFVNDYLPCYNDPEVGDYHKYVLAGTYDILVKANGYADKMVSGVTVSSMSSTVTDIELDPLEHQNVYKFISSQIEDNNPGDEGYTWNVIGQPDNMNYSLGKAGWCVLDMYDIIFDGAGPDLMVFEGDASAEGYTIYAGETMDGPWNLLGTGNGTAEFDFENCSISEARYFKIVDDGDGPASGNDVGFDLDAVQALSSVTGPYIIMDGYVVDDANGNNNGLLDPGETADFIVTLKNVGTEDALGITGTFTTEDDYLTIITTTPQDFGDISINGSAEAIFTVSADENAPAGHVSVINFEYEGTNVDPNTKYIQVSFPDYCEASTTTEDEFIAHVECGDIDNASGWQGGVANYTDMMVTAEPGAEVPITVTNGTAWASDQVKVWVDWNLDFEMGSPANEAFALTNVGGSGETFTGNIVIPEGQNPGMYRMRIRMTYSSEPQPCGNASYGEVEDYTVNVSGDVLVAGFYADETWICHGTEVQYHDNSVGNVTSWSWEFPGGTPETSTEQNPMVTYNTPGIYGATLTVSDGTNESTEAMLEYMVVDADPEIPNAPQGETEMCQDAVDCDYSTDPGSCTDWEWEIVPATAGTMTQNGPAITVDWNPDFAGDVQIMVAGINTCGQSDMSDPVNVVITPFPGTASAINGLQDVCQGDSEEYSTTDIADADSYEWTLEPQEAGSVVNNGNTCNVLFSEDYVGNATMNVRGINPCGEGIWSPDFTVTVHNCSSIQDLNPLGTVKVVPNPNNGHFELELLNIRDENLKVEIFNTSGKKVYGNKMVNSHPGQKVPVGLIDIPSGVYYLKITGDSETTTSKILIHQ